MSRMVKVAAAALGTAAAVAAAFFLHPRSGARRRAAVRRESANVAALVGSAIDTPRRTLRRTVPPDTAAEQATLALRVSFGEAAEQITVRSARGVVTLRGEVDDIADIARYEAAVRGLPGVVDVDNLLRLRLAGSSRPKVLTA